MIPSLKIKFVIVAPSNTPCPTSNEMIVGVALAVTIVTASSPDNDASRAVTTNPAFPKIRIPMFEAIEMRRKMIPKVNAGLSANGEANIVTGFSRVDEFLRK